MKQFFRYSFVFVLSILLSGFVFWNNAFAATGCSTNIGGTGNWHDSKTWTRGCTGPGGIPSFTDTVTISSGTQINVSADAVAASIIIAAQSNTISLSNSLTLNSGTLRLTWNITLTEPKVVATSGIIVNGGNLIAKNITIPGSTIKGRNAFVRVDGWTMTLSGNVVFSGSAAQAQLINNSTVSVGGNFWAGGTLSGTGTINFNGTGAQTLGAYTTYNHVTVNKTAGTLSSAGNTTIGGNLTVTDWTLSLWAHTITVTGTTSISDTLTLSSATGAKTFVWAVTINNWGKWMWNSNWGPNLSVVFKGGLVNNGTFDSGTATLYTFNTNNQIIAWSAPLSLSNLTISGVNVTNKAILTVSNDLAGTGWLIQGTGSVLNLWGSSTISTLIATASWNPDDPGNIVNYNGTVAQTIKSTTYNHLKVNNTAATGASLGAGITLTTLTIGDVAAASRFQDAGFVITPSGSSVLNLTQGTYDLGSATVATSFPAFITRNIASGTTVEYGWSGPNQVVSWTPNYYHLLITWTSKTVNWSLSVSWNLTVNMTVASQIFQLWTYTGHTVNGNIDVTFGSLVLDTSTISLQGNLSWAWTFNGSTGTLKLTGGNTQTLSVTTFSPYHLTVQKTTNTTASITTATTIGGNLTITTGTLDMPGVVITVTGTTSISGTLTLSSATGAKTFVWAVTINNWGIWNETHDAIPTFKLGLTNNGTFTAASGIHTFDTNGQQIGWSSVLSIPNITVTWVTLTNKSTVGLTVWSDLAGTGGLTQGTDAVLNLWWTSTITTLIATLTGNTVNYNGTETQTVKNTNYFHLIVSGGSSKSITLTNNNWSILGTFQVKIDTTFTTSGNYQFIVDGDLTVDSGGVLQIQGSLLKSWWNITHNGLIFDINQSLIIDSNDVFLYWNSRIEIYYILFLVYDSIVTNYSIGWIDVYSTIWGIYEDEPQGYFIQGENALLIWEWSPQNNLILFDVSAIGNTVRFNNIYNNIPDTQSWSYYNLIISSWWVPQSLYRSVNWNLTIESGAVLQIENNIIINGTTTISWTLNPTSSHSPTFVWPVIINNGGTWNETAAVTPTFKWGLTNNGTLTALNGIHTFNTNNQSIEGSSAISIPNLTVNGVTLTNTSTVGLTVWTALSGTGGLTQGTDAVLNLWWTSGITTLTATESGNTVNYNGSASQSVKSTTYHHLTFWGGAGTNTLGGPIINNGNLTINSWDTLDTSSGNNYAITVKGDWSNTGTFTPRQGTVTFNGTGTQTINDSNSWYGLSITTTSPRTVYFESGATQSIQSGGSLILTGIASNILTLAPLTPASAWNLQLNTAGVTQNISYVSVSYSDAGPSPTYATILAGNNVTDGGNNINWNFGWLSLDIVDEGWGSVVSPSVGMSSTSFSLQYQTTTGTLGTSSQKIRVTNSTPAPQWSVTLAATSGPTTLWSAGTPKYDFNDPTASALDGGDSDGYGGQLTVNPSVGTLTPQSGCTNTGVSKGSSSAFSEGVTNSITLVSSSGSAQTNCYWDFTGITLSQDIPQEQTVASYALDMTLTITAI